MHTSAVLESVWRCASLGMLDLKATTTSATAAAATAGATNATVAATDATAATTAAATTY
jgi:hypothetical protein